MKIWNPQVVGLDPSLKSTGVSDGHHHQVIQTSGLRGEDRLWHIKTVLDRLTRGADLVVMEGMAYGRMSQAGHSELAGLHWLIRLKLHKSKIPFAVVPPTTLKKYTTGSGTADKPDMVAALDERFCASLADVKVTHGRHDMADALGLAAMGLDYLGHPMVALTEPHRASLHSVQWPELVCT